MSPSFTEHDIVAIGGSAGALDPLREIVRALPEKYRGSIFIVLHASYDAPNLMPQLLAQFTQLPVTVPEDKERFRHGHIYVAPPDFHLLIEDGRVRVTRGPRENRHRPAIDPLFRSAAKSCGERVIAVLLSGALDDGTAGFLAVKIRGGVTIAQDPNEAMFPSMPLNAIQHAGADYVLPAAEIAATLADMAEARNTPESPTRESSMSENVEKEAKKANLEVDANAEAREGRPSVFACPECHGVLWEVENGEILRFRCRVGHSYTAQSLRVALSEASEEALWMAMRALDEKADLLRRVAARSPSGLAARQLEEAESLEKHARQIREMLIQSQDEERAQGTSA